MGRAVGSFHPSAMPPLTRGLYRRELFAWVFLPLMIGAADGSVVGVITKNAFEGRVDASVLNFAVAIITGANAFANISSFLWASLSHGRHKIRFVVGLILLATCFVLMMGFAPLDETGLIMFVVGVVGARVCWAGVATLRSTVWRANYPRHVRARITGKFATIQALIIAGIGAGFGWLMDWDITVYRIVFPFAGVCGIVGALMYRRLRVRSHVRLLRNERTGDQLPRGTPLSVVRILLGDRPFLVFMTCQFIFGLGNMMINAPLAIMLKDTFGVQNLVGILIMFTIPVTIMPIAIPIWARLMDRSHIVRFRAIHSWMFVTAALCFFIAAESAGQPFALALLFGAAVVRGLAFGGGVLAWNLGHHDFATVDQASQYMGVHMTLTGIRGLIAPILAWALYEIFNEMGDPALVFLVCFILSLTGALGFVAMSVRGKGAW